MKKYLLIAILAMLILCACGSDKKDKTSDTQRIDVFEQYSRSFNEGEKTLSLKLYTNDYKYWNAGVESAAIIIGNKSFEATSQTVLVNDELVNNKYYVGKVEVSCLFSKAQGEAKIKIKFKDGSLSEYALGYIYVGNSPSDINNYFGNISFEGITKNVNGKVGNYGLLMHITVFNDVTLWGLRMGIENVYANTSLVYEIDPKDVENIRGAIKNGTLDLVYEDCYKRTPGNNSCMANFMLCTGEHYIYVPFQFVEGFFDVKSSIFDIRFSADGLAPTDYTTEEFVYIHD